MTYCVITAAVIAGCIFLGPAGIGVLAGYTATMTFEGAIAGAVIGAAWCGTNGFKDKFDLERAARGMMKGSIYGAIAGYCLGGGVDCYYANQDLAINSLLSSDSGIQIQLETSSTSLEGSSLLGRGVAEVATISGSTSFGYTAAIFALDMCAVYSTPMMVEKLVNHHTLDISLGNQSLISYDFDSHEWGGAIYDAGK